MIFPWWAAFAVVNGALMFRYPEHETIPFHFIWISLSVVYGIRPWSRNVTAVTLAAVVAFSSYSINRAVQAGRVDWQEITEVPLMALVFLTMVWHVQRRVAALRRSETLAASERRAHEMKELFVRNCSHEMRTPITVARGYTELVSLDMESDSGRQDLGMVLDELAKLEHLASRLVALAEAYETSDFRLERVELDKLLERTVQRWRPAAQRCWVVETEQIEIVGDRSRLEASLDALVENAVKFTLDGGQITLRCRSRNGLAVVEVEDDGLGLTRSAEQSGPPHSSGTRGTGLGLSIVRAVVEGHSGTLTLGEVPSGGALVTTTLPLVAPDAADAPPVPRLPGRRPEATRTRA